jgi:hypothetical protein
MKSIIWNDVDRRITQGHGVCWQPHQQPFFRWYQYSADYGMQAGCHPGIDVSMPVGTELFAPCDGTIVCAGTGRGTGADSCAAFNYTTTGSPPGGGRVQIQREDTGDMIIFGHCLDSVVRPGQRVRRGEVIAHSGWKPAPHLHLEVRVKATGQTRTRYLAVDPIDYLQKLTFDDVVTPTDEPGFAERLPFPFEWDGKDKILDDGTTVYAVHRFVRAKGGGKVRQIARLDADEVREPLHRDEVFEVHYALESDGEWWWYTPFASRVLQSDTVERVRVEIDDRTPEEEEADRAKTDHL